VGVTRLAERLARVSLGIFPTPLVRARRLESALGRGPLLIKRDDLAGFGVAGNKTRPLEFLVGEALARRARVLVTGGGPGSNFCPASALAARAVGLDCELVVWGEPDALDRAPNLALARAAGAVVRPTRGSDRDAVDELVRQRAEALSATGRPAYPVPRGGSTELGAAGFAVAAVELAQQLDRLDVLPRLIVLSVGSGGSCAGLLAGLAAIGLDVPVLGVSVSRAPERIEPRVWELAAGCARLLGTPAPAGRLDIVDARGLGFGQASDLEIERGLLAWRTEGLLFDQTYGVEALSSAIDAFDASGRLGGGPGPEPVVLWHTGGLVPAIDMLTTTAKDNGP
jgi:1-aminocyclopropane-1-carboxylate deaminase/D-cysteine desulfhydrase-like pyridoxal-dependent ACC family enzyme